MTLEFLNQEMIKAMKENDKLARDTIRTIIANVKKTVIDERCDTTEELVDRVLLKELKTINEMIDTCPADRVETLEEYNLKKEIISKYAPKILTDEDEIEEYINYIVNNYEVNITNTNTAMKTIMPHLKGKCDMKIASSVIRGLGF